MKGEILANPVSVASDIRFGRERCDGAAGPRWVTSDGLLDDIQQIVREELRLLHALIQSIADGARRPESTAGSDPKRVPDRGPGRGRREGHPGDRPHLDPLGQASSDSTG